MKLIDYYPFFIRALEIQLNKDNRRWGNEWKKRPIEANDEWKHQNIRVFDRFDDYLMDWLDKGIPIPWLKICGNAFIAYTRENNPDYDK